MTMADIEFKETDIDKNPTEEQVVTGDSPLKEWLVNYTGEQLQPEDGNVTVEMIVGTIANEFPEFLLVVAEENFIRGYEQALNDVEEKEANETEE
tara:strand:+ start:34 stop:318 length:285 start_codon:yes stop_codon:yes gene_type:complete